MAITPPVAPKPIEKKEVTKPWEPASMLTVPKSMIDKIRAEGYGLRWCTEDNLSKSIAEGWQPVQGNAKELAPAARLIDGTQLTNIIRKGALILCKMPLTMIAEREKYFKNLQSESLKGVQRKLNDDTKVKDSVFEEEGSAYGNIKIESGPLKDVLKEENKGA